MERLFGISYPTVKSRLNKIAQKFDFLNISSPDDYHEESAIDLLRDGKISVEDAIKELKK